MNSGYYETKQNYPKEYKRSCWDAAIGLQEVDGLKPSEYLRELSGKHIEGELNLYEIEQLLYERYNDETEQEKTERKKEADIVSARIARLLQEPGFTFSPMTLKYIHRTLFEGIYSHAGRFRDYNISKDEPILGGRTVNYANYQMIQDTLDYDFEQEKRQDYLSTQPEKVLKRITTFSSSIWQVHPFGEGNTRTTAVFMQMYLNHMGFKVDNSLFRDNSLYFRNALVRSNYADYSNNIMPDTKPLEMFYENLLFETSHTLRNRDLIVPEYTNEIKKVLKEEKRNPKGPKL